MNDRDLLLRAVQMFPDEDTPRLVFADWLDEHGESERAEFIRLQVEHSQRGGGLEGCENLLRRSQQLLRRVAMRCMPFKLPNGAFVHCIGIENDPTTTDTIFQVFAPGSHSDFYFVRGWIERVACSAADWLRHADAILAEHPVRRVTLTTWPALVPAGDEIGDKIELADAADSAFAVFWNDVHGGYTVPSAFVRELTLNVLRERWEDIKFDLPPAPALNAADWLAGTIPAVPQHLFVPFS